TGGIGGDGRGAGEHTRATLRGEGDGDAAHRVAAAVGDLHDHRGRDDGAGGCVHRLLREGEIDARAARVGQGEARRCGDASHRGGNRVGAHRGIGDGADAGMAAGIGGGSGGGQRRRGAGGWGGEGDRDAVERVAGGVADQHLQRHGEGRQHGGALRGPAGGRDRGRRTCCNREGAALRRDQRRADGGELIASRGGDAQIGEARQTGGIGGGGGRAGDGGRTPGGRVE